MMNIRNQDIFVIGGSGFIGSHLVNYFLKHQCNVFFPTSREFNLTDESTWKSLDIACSISIICASEISNDFISLKTVNEDPLEKLYYYLKENGIQKIIYLSSGSVYGTYKGIANSETFCRPNTPYGKSKLKSERILSSVCRGDLNILRIYFPYGPNQRLPRLIPKMIDSIKKGLPIMCNVDGGPHISVTHIYDLVNVIYSDFIMKDNRDRVTNIASPVVLSIREIAERLSQAIGTPVLYEPSSVEKYNTISEPYPASQWEYSGTFEGLVI